MADLPADSIYSTVYRRAAGRKPHTWQGKASNPHVGDRRCQGRRYRSFNKTVESDIPDGASPAIVPGLSSAAGGGALTPIYGALAMFLISTTVKDVVATAAVGPKDGGKASGR